MGETGRDALSGVQGVLMADKEDAILSSYMGGGICVDRGGCEDMPERKEATQDMYITELQRENARTKTMFENICEDIKDLRSDLKEILAVVTKTAADAQSDRIATDMRVTKVENDLSTVHARLDEQHNEIQDIKDAPGKRAEKQVQTVGKKVFEYGAVGALMLLILGLKEWLRGL